MTKKRQGADIRAQSKRQANAFWKLLRPNTLDGAESIKANESCQNSTSNIQMDTYVLTQYVSISKLLSIVG